MFPKEVRAKENNKRAICWQRAGTHMSFHTETLLCPGVKSHGHRGN